MTEPTAAEIEAAARALFVQQNEEGIGAEWWDQHLTDWGKRAWRADVAPILAAALPLVEARLREEIAAEIEAIDVTLDSPFGQIPFRTKAEAARIVRGES